MRTKKLTAVTALLLVLTIGCGIAASTWITEAEAIVTALVPAAGNLWALVSVLKGGQVSTADLQAIQQASTEAQNDLQLIQGLITQYNAADATEKPGILIKIQTTAQLVNTNLSNLLPALHIKDAATQAKITAVTGIIIAEINSLVAIVPIVNPQASHAMVEMATKQARKTPPLRAKDFKKSYNAILTAKTGNAELDTAAKGLVLH